MRLADRLRALFDKRERETPFYQALALKLYSNLQDKYVYEPLLPYLKRFVEHPCERTSDELIGCMTELRATAVAEEGWPILIDPIEGSLGRTLTERERRILFEVRSEEGQTIRPVDEQGILEDSEFEAQVVTILEKSICRLAGRYRLPTDLYELEAVRLGLHRVYVKSGEVPLILLLAGQAILRKRNNLIDGEPTVDEEEE